MYNASSNFKSGIYATSRMNKGRVTFDVSDVTASGDVSSVTATGEASLSNKGQLVNKVRNSTYKLATNEKNRTVLDGSWSFADDTLANNGEIGWASDVIGDSGGGMWVNNILGDTSNRAQFIGWTAYQGAIITLTQGQADPIGGTGATRIQSSGGTNVMKYYTSPNVSAGVAGTPCTTTAWVKNQGLSTVYIRTQLGGTFTIPTGGVWTKVFIQYTANGTSSRQFRFECTSASDVLDVVAFQPQLTETNYEQPFTVGSTTPPSVTVNFNGDHSSIGLTVTFDTVNNEYATDFTLTAYNSSNAVVASYSYTGNTLAQVAAYGQLTNYRKVTLTVNKWSVPNRRARVAEVDFGIVKVYTGEAGLVSMGLTEEMDLTSGNFASPEFKFVVDNSNREFNILNPTGFYKSLQQKQQVVGEIGLTYDNGIIEWIPIGNYLLWEWQSDEGSLTSTFYARTQLDLMGTINYGNSVPTTSTLGAMAQSIFALCGVTNYSIDPALFSINTNQLIKQTNCKNVLQMIAIAGCANIFVTRDGIITLKVLSAPTTVVDTISMNDQYAEPRIILENVVSRVDVSYYTSDPNTAAGTSTSTTSAKGDTFKLDGNTLINDVTRAGIVGQWLLAQKNYRALYTVNWRGNQAHELGDVVAIGNSYGTDMKAYVTKTELTYQGYVQATTEAKGVAN